MIKRIISVILIIATVAVLCASCSDKKNEEIYSSPANEKFLKSLEAEMTTQLCNTLDGDSYRIDNVEAIYLSKEYMDELDFNSKQNVYFGYTLAEVEELFGEEKYVFTLGEDGSTVVEPFEPYNDTFGKTLKKVAIGAGVIIICVTVTVIAVKTGPVAVKAFMALSPKIAGATSGMKLSPAIIGKGLSIVGAGVIEGIETKDFGKALDAVKDEALEEFAFSAIAGFVGDKSEK